MIGLRNQETANLSLGSSALQPFLAGLANGWADKELWVIMEFFEQMSGVRVRPPDLSFICSKLNNFICH